MNQFNKTAKPGSRKQSKSWTLLVVGDLGNTVSFRLSKPLLVTLTVCAATVFILIVFLTVSSLRVRVENGELKRELGQIRAQLAAAKEDKDEALVRLMLKEGPVKSDEKDGESIQKFKPSEEVSEGPIASVASGKGKEADASEEIKTVAEASPAKPMERSEETQPALAGGVSVDRLEIRPADEGHFLEYRFVVKNVDPQGRRMKGYTFVVLQPREGSEARPAVSPSTLLDAGRPAIFKKGQYFSITRFKPVQGTFPGAAAMEPFKTATVYVYSETGSLLAEQVYQADQLSGS